jgi:hypothetical protein
MQKFNPILVETAFLLSSFRNCSLLSFLPPSLFGEKIQKQSNDYLDSFTHFVIRFCKFLEFVHYFFRIISNFSTMQVKMYINQNNEDEGYSKQQIKKFL